MAKQIKSTDIVENDVFSNTIKSADALLVSLKQVNTELKGIGDKFRVQLKDNPLKSSSDLKQYASDINQIDAVTKQLSKTQEAIKKTEEALVLARKEEALVLEKLKVEKQEVNRQTKLEATIQNQNIGAYKRTSAELIVLRARYKDYLTQVRQGVKLTDTQQKEFDELAKSVDKLDKELKDIDATAGQFQRNVGDYKGQLKELQKELQKLEPGSEQFNKLAARAGELKDKIDDAKNATKAFAKDSKTAVGATLFKQIGQDLAELDFAGAADKAKTLASVVKGITFQEVANGIKNLGSTLLNLGKSLLLNPFVLLIGALTAIGGLLYREIQLWRDNEEAIKINNKALEESIKLRNELQKQIDANSLRFLTITKKINDGEQQRIELLSQVNDELDDNRQRYIDNIKEQLKAFNVTKLAFDNQKKFIKERLKLNDQEIESLRKVTLAGDISGKFEDYKEFTERTLALQKIFNDERIVIERKANSDLELLDTQQKFDELERQKEQNEKKKKLQEDFIKNNKDLQKQIEDLQVDLIKDDFIREQERVKLEAKRRIETINATVADQKLKAKLIGLIEDKLLQDLYAINQKYWESLKKLQDDKIKELNDARAKALVDAEKERLLAIQELEKRRLEQEKIADDERKKRDEERISRIKDTIKFISQLADKTIEAINKQKDAEIKRQDEEIKKREDNVKRQEDLAKQGLTNTLAFEKRKLAEAELEKKRLQEEQERREKRQVFYKNVIASLENAKSPSEAGSAIARAFALTVLAETFANAFATGVEGLNGPGTGTSDSIPAWLSKGESVITAKGTQQYAGLATAMNEGTVGDWVKKNGTETITHTDYQSLRELREIKNALRSQSQINVNWNSHDERVETMVKDGYKKTVRTIRRRPLL